MSAFVLFNYFRSSTSYRVRIALNLKNIPYEYKAVHLLKNGGEQYLPEYKALNPLSEVPTLVHEGRPISQSMAIIEYLEDIQETPPLFPEDPYKKAKVRQFCENINSFLHPVNNLKVQQKLEMDHQYDAEKKAQWVQYWTTPGLAVLEGMLTQTKGTYSFGNQITAADVFLIPALFSAQRFQVKLEAFPQCLEIYNTCLELEVFKRAHPYRQPDTPESDRIT